MADKRLIPPGIKDLNTEALNDLSDRLGTLDLTPLLIYIIDDVDSSALPYLAHQFHIEGWELAQTEQEKRNLIKRAIELHRYKGTKWSVINALSAAGYEVDLKEWFEYNGDPYKFRVLVKSVIQDEDRYRKLTELINEYKNVRSWLDAIGFHREFTNNIYYAFAQKNGKHYQIGLHVDTSVKPNTLYTGIAQRSATSYQIGIYELQASVEQATLYAGIAQRSASYMAIYPSN